MFQFLRQKITGIKYLNLILKEARILATHPEETNFHLPKCSACLAAEARSNVDEKLDDEGPCFEEGDIYMFEAKSILSKELGWPLEGEEEKEIISKNEFNERKHGHLDDLKCPKCGRGLKPLVNRGHLVGCMEYEIFICDKGPKNCRILIVNYPHESAEKRNKIINL